MGRNALLERCEKLGVFSAKETGVIGRAFHLMSIAETEIKREYYQHSKKVGRRVWNSFALLPPGILVDYGDDLYRAHCREILGRVVREEDTRLATKAEVLAHISKATLASRLQHDVEELALRLAKELYPAFERGPAKDRESYPGACDELLQEFRKKCGNKDRVPKEEQREVPAHLEESTRWRVKTK